MSGNWLKYVAIASVVLAVVLAIVAYRWTSALTESAEREAQAEVPPVQPTTLAVIAVAPIAANAPIPTDAVALKPVAVVPPNYFTQTEEVVGRIPLIDIDPGAPVTPRYFRQTNILARIIPAGHQAVSLEVSDVVAVGGFVKPGDEVDLLLYVRGGESPAQARLLLEKVLVLAYEDRVIERPQGLTAEERPERRSSRVRTAVVAVPTDKSTKVMLGASVGDIRLALHRQTSAQRGDDRAEGLPAAPAGGADQRPAAERERAITVAELTALKVAKPEPEKKPPPYTIQIHRGDKVNKVTD